MRYIQPQSGPTRADPANPLARGLIAGSIPHLRTDIVSGKPYTQEGAYATTTATAGIGLVTNGTNSDIFIAIPQVVLKTFCLFGVFKSNGNTTDARVLGFGSSLNTIPIVSIGSGFGSATKVRVFVRDDDGGGAGADSTGTPFDGTLHAVALDYDGANLRCYIDGKLDTTVANSNLTFTVDRFCIGALYRSSAAVWWAGSTYIGAGWNRSLSSAEHAQLAANPYQLVKSPQRVIPASTPAGIQFDAAGNSGYQTAQSTYSFNRTVTGSNTFLAVDVELLSVPGTTVTGITDNGVAMTFIGAQSTVSSVGRVEQWGIVNPATGTHAIVVTLSASINSAATAASYTGVNQTVPTEAFNSAQATNVGAADAVVVVTSIADNCWVHAAVATTATTITANQTSRNNVSGAAGSGANEDNGAAKTPAGAVTMSYTGLGALATWSIAGYAIRPLAASSPATGTFASTLNDATMVASGAVTDAGTFATTMGNATMAAAGAVTDIGSFASTMDSFTMAATGTVNDTGAFISTMDNSTMAASGMVSNTGIFATTMASVIMVASGSGGTVIASAIKNIITRHRARSRSRSNFSL